MSHADRELSRREYHRTLKRIAWERTIQQSGPWLRRLKERLILSLFIAVAFLASFFIVSFWYPNREFFSIQNVVSTLLITLVMAVLIGIIFSVVYLVQLVCAPYEFYREVRNEAGKWLAKLNTQIRQSQEMRKELLEQCEAEKDELRRQIQKLETGPSDSDLARLALEELRRNKTRKGMMTGSPERKHLDALIERFEQRLVSNELTKLLYELRERTEAQEKLAGYSVAQNSQFKSHYLPLLEKVEEALLNFIHQNETATNED